MGPTVAILQTPPGRGGIAVIALVGPETEKILSEIFRPLKTHSLSGDRRLQLGHLISDGEIIDEAVVRCAGREAEINIHGGPAVARAVMELLVRFGAKVVPPEELLDASFRPDHPRWDNPAIGREMLATLPKAYSKVVVAAVSQQWSAGISQLARSDTPSAEKLRAAAAGLEKAERLLNPAEVALAGKPNAGKSSLANALIGREVSIVHPTAATTRDWVRELALIDGLPIWLTDTAGLWEPPGEIDAEAVRRARARLEQADLVLLLSAGEQTPVPDWLHAKNFIRIQSKCDLHPPPDAELAVSSVTGEGLGDLKRAILDALGLGDFNQTDAMAFTQRQRDLLLEAAETVEQSDRPSVRRILQRLLKE